MIQRKLFYFIFVLFVSYQLPAQDVTISKEFNIRNDYAYEVVGEIDKKIILMRDRGLRYEIELLEQDMTHQLTRELIFEKRKIKFLGTVPQDTSFLVFYHYAEKKYEYLKCRNYSPSGILLDSTTVFTRDKSFGSKRYRLAFSKDKTKTLVYRMDGNTKIDCAVVDNQAMEVLSDDYSVFEEFNLKKDLRRVLVTNKGDVMVFLEKDNTRFKRENHFAKLFHMPLNAAEVLEYDFYFDKKLSVDNDINYDEVNNRVNIAGLYNDGNTSDSKGYYHFSKGINALQRKETLTFVPFGNEFVAEVYGKKSTKDEVLKNFRLQDLVFTQEGGVILIAEMKKKLSRRSSFGNPGAYRMGGYGAGSWVDYMDEDLVLVHVGPTGEEYWRRVLYKKQFSQDDGGAFSSFFPFMTPSRLRLIFNDEINKNSTVSEYVLSPSGRNERNALLSTEDQELNLRFRDAVQISSHELLVSSERKQALSLVKISFGQ